MTEKTALILIFERLRTACGDLSEVGRFASELLPLVEEAIAAQEQVKTKAEQRRGTSKLRYYVEVTQQGEVLTEERLSGKSKAFRCRRDVYDAIATVLSDAQRPLLLDEIMSGLERILPDRPAEHQVRVALRLWMHADPPLVGRNRARYRPHHAESLTGSANQIWKNLRLTIR